MSAGETDKEGRLLAPYHWIRTRPYGKLLTDAARDISFLRRAIDEYRKKDAPETADIINAVLHYGHTKTGIPVDDKPSVPIRYWDQQMISSILNFATKGMNIFSFDREVTEAMLNTDLGDATPNDFTHPYLTYYLHFDMEEPLILPNGREFEGILVGSPDDDEDACDDGKAIFFTILCKATKDAGTWPHINDWGYEMSIPVDHQDKPLLDAIRAAHDTQARWIDGGDASVNPYPKDFIPQADMLLKLAANAIMYISRYAGDAKMEWPESAPRDLVEQAEKGKRSAEKQLIRKGHVKTRLVTFGRHSSQEDGEATGRSVKPHWRRGHWKRQPYGPGRSLRKLILVPPTRVAFKEGNTEVKARQYAVTAQG